MCFSVEASFGAAAALSAIGVASLKKAKYPNEKAFAAIPVIFAVQQVFEGLIWLSDGHSDYEFLRPFSAYAFLFFAQVVWPVWIPYSVFRLSKSKKLRTIQQFLVAFGVFSSTYLAYCLLNFPIDAKVVGYHIVYDQKYPESLNLLSGIIYMIATVLPPFVSGVKRVWILGLAIFISYLITAIFYTGYIVSVWCFFAAIISGFVLFIFYSRKSQPKTIISDLQ